MQNGKPIKNKDLLYSDQCPECGAIMHTEYEQRSPGYIEAVQYCEQCGSTAIGG